MIKSSLHSIATIEVSSSISQAFNLINSNNGNNIFVLRNGIFCGSISDGDLRRAIINGAQLKDSVEKATNFNATFVTLENSNDEVERLFQDKFDFLPVLNSSKQLIRILKKGEKINIPISEPNLTKRDIELVLDTLMSNMVSSFGTYVHKFEENFAEYLGVDPSRVIAVSNGTQALYIALTILGIADSEVIVPSMTFGATANAVIQSNGIPIFADIDSKGWNIDIKKLPQLISKKTKAIIPVHLYGNPIDMQELQEFATKHQLTVIEDAAEALGSKVGSNHVGTDSDASTFSFYGNKTITTGEGGIVVFKDKGNAERARLFINHGMTKQNRYFHSHWGSNFRLTNMQAALGCAQLERIELLVNKKIEIKQIYRSRLEPYGCVFAKNLTNATDSSWLSAFLLPETNDTNATERCISFLLANGIEARRFFLPLDNQPAFSSFRNTGDDLSISQKIFERGICLPSATTISDAEINYICSKMIFFLESEK
jgi:perosamine synthetase